MGTITEKELAEVLIGIAKTQAAIIQALQKHDGHRLFSDIKSTVGGAASYRSKPNLQNLSARLLDKALSTPGPKGQTIEQLAHQELSKLVPKS